MRRRESLSRGLILLGVLLAAGCSENTRPTEPLIPPVVPDNPDRAVLVALYNATGGSGWESDGNWNSASAIRTWYGVRTNSSGAVTELVLDDNNLTGTLPSQLGELAELERLVLDGNSLTGRVPPDLGNLGKLTMLNLRDNSLSGSIPAELGALASLDTLDLFNNDLSGPIPAALGNLASVQRLTVGWNELTGPIPAELGQLDNATYINFSRNELTGTIPPEPRHIPLNDGVTVISINDWRSCITCNIQNEQESMRLCWMSVEVTVPRLSS